MVFPAATARLHAACLRTFGVQCTLAGSPITGVYRAPYAEAFGIATTSPTLQVRTADLTVTPNGQAVAVPSEGTFRVARHEPDGTGWSTLVLEAP